MKIGPLAGKERFFLPNLWEQVSSPPRSPTASKASRPKPDLISGIKGLYRPPRKKIADPRIISLDLDVFWEKIQKTSSQVLKVLNTSGNNVPTETQGMSSFKGQFELDFDLELTLEIDPENGTGNLHFELSLSREVAYQGMVTTISPDGQTSAKLAYMRQEELDVDLDLTFSLDGTLRPLTSQRAVDTGRYFISWAKDNMVAIYDRLSGVSTALKGGKVDQVLYSALKLADESQVVIEQGPGGLEKVIVSREAELSYAFKEDLLFSSLQDSKDPWGSFLNQLKALDKLLA